jgi:hypothetical protein
VRINYGWRSSRGTLGAGWTLWSVEHAAVLQRPDRGASVVSGGDATVPSVMCCGLFEPGLDCKRRRSIERIEPPSDSHRAIGSDGMSTSHPVMQPQRHQPSGGRLGLAHPVSTVSPHTIRAEICPWPARAEAGLLASSPSAEQEKAQPPDLASVMLVVEALHGAIPTTVGEAVARGYDGGRCIMLRAEQRC